MGPFPGLEAWLVAEKVKEEKVTSVAFFRGEEEAKECIEKYW